MAGRHYAKGDIKMDQIVALFAAAAARDPVAVVSLLGMGSTALLALWMTGEVLKSFAQSNDGAKKAA